MLSEDLAHFWEEGRTRIVKLRLRRRRSGKKKREGGKAFTLQVKGCRRREKCLGNKNKDISLWCRYPTGGTLHCDITKVEREKELPRRRFQPLTGTV